MIVPKQLYIWILWSVTIVTHALIVTSSFQYLTVAAGVSRLAMAQHAINTILLARVVRVAQIPALLISIFSPPEGFAMVERC